MIEFIKKRWVYHSIIWLITFIVMGILSYPYVEDSKNLFAYLEDPLFFIIPASVTIYMAFWAKETLFDKRKYLIYFIAFVLIIIIGVFIYESLEILFDRSRNLRRSNIANFVFIQIMAVGLQYFKRGIVNQFQLQELKAKTVTTELNALKAQINPHFLFNTLNNIYGMNQIDSEKGSEMILELSDVMRYHLEFSKEAEVKLEDEIQLLESYIKLEQLRLRETCDLKVDLTEVNKKTMVSPLLFIPFVENAFKHGTHPTKACHIHIKLKSSSNHIYFKVKNSIITDRKVVKTNIGIKNTKRRLDLIYPNKHTLSIVKNEKEHIVELNIEL